MSITGVRIEMSTRSSVSVSDGGPIVDATGGKVKSTQVPRGTIVLTFDDGPDLTNTPVVLDQLKLKGVKATFFINTENSATVSVNTNATAQAIVKRIVNEGHVLANHSVHHEHLPQDTAARVTSEVNDVQTTVNTIFGASAPKLTLFRAPFGEPYQTRDATGLALVAPIVKAGEAGAVRPSRTR